MHFQGLYISLPFEKEFALKGNKALLFGANSFRLGWIPALKRFDLHETKQGVTKVKHTSLLNTHGISPVDCIFEWQKGKRLMSKSRKICNSACTRSRFLVLWKAAKRFKSKIHDCLCH